MTPAHILAVWARAYTGLAHEIERAALNREDSQRLMERGR